MPTFLTDVQIQQLVTEPKPLPPNYVSLIQLKPKTGHKERELELMGTSGSEFRLILRQSNFNPLDFSVILAHRPAGTSQVIRLRRYNGKSHEHTNALEGNRFYDFHIHYATERYQNSGFREDAYAEPTTSYADFQGAVSQMISDCGFQLPPNQQNHLF